jgi:hypothetical protein
MNYLQTTAINALIEGFKYVSNKFYFRIRADAVVPYRCSNCIGIIV